jgi:hypothetical protein
MVISSHLIGFVEQYTFSESTGIEPLNTVKLDLLCG